MQAKKVAEELSLVRDTFKTVARANDLRDFNSFVALLERHGSRDANELIRSLVAAIEEPEPTETTSIPDVQALVARLSDAGVDRGEYNKVAQQLEAQKKSLSLPALNLVVAGYVGSVKNYRNKKAALTAIDDHFETLFQRARKSREILGLTAKD